MSDSVNYRKLAELDPPECRRPGARRHQRYKRHGLQVAHSPL